MLARLETIPLLVGLAMLAATDLRARRLPNTIVLPLWACGIAMHAWAIGASGGFWAGLGSLAAATPLYLAWNADLCGGGDVKLAGAIGAWLGPAPGLAVLVGALLVGGLYALGQLLASAPLRREVGAHLILAATGGGLQAPRRPRQRTVPFGAALALSAATVALWLGIPNA